MTITGVQVKHQRVFIEADGVLLGTVDTSVWLDSGMDVGSVAEQEDIENLMVKSLAAEAKRRALNMLSRRSYSKRTITDRIARQTGEEAAQQAADRMEELGLLDDDDYACRMAQDCFRRRGFAKRRVLLHLRQNGIDRDTAERAAAFIDESSQAERAYKILKYRYGSIKDALTRKKAFALLERLGYSRGEAVSALRRAGDDTEFEDDQWD